MQPTDQAVTAPGQISDARTLARYQLGEATAVQQHQVRDRVHGAERKPPRWNGRERRRKPSLQAAGAAASAAFRGRPLSHSAGGLAQRLPPHLRVLALWSSIALTGAVLILIYHL